MQMQNEGSSPTRGGAHGGAEGVGGSGAWSVATEWSGLQMHINANSVSEVCCIYGT